MKTVYRAGRIKRRARRTRAQVEQLEQQIIDVLQADHPQSIRHVYYRLTDPRLPEPIEKTDHGYGQVQDRLVKMRRRGVIPYGWITDTTRRGYHVETYRSPAEALRAWQAGYRRDIWDGCEDYVEVWCESRSIAGVVQGVCEELAVSLYPAGGFASLTIAYDAALWINHVTGHGERAANVIYIGDYDPAGVTIDVKIEDELRTHLHDDVMLEFSRIAITPEQIIEYDLPTKPRKTTDKRALHITETVEAEAMPANIMRSLLRTAIEYYLPPGALRTARAAEESERSMFEWAARQMNEAV